MAMSMKRNQKRRFRLFQGIVSWWKRRYFYVAQNDTLDHDEESIILAGDHHGLLSQTTSSSAIKVPRTHYFPTPLASRHTIPHPFVRNRTDRTKDSFQGSLESLDSLNESYWDPEDETSQATAVASNIAHQKDFFVEHLGFLSVQTRPRQVELVYNR
jgi:hypothetical protein